MVQHDSSQFVIFASDSSPDALRVLQKIKSFKPVFSTRLPKPIRVVVCKLTEMREVQDMYGSSTAMTFNSIVLVTPDRRQIPCEKIVDFLQGVASAPRASPVRDETGRVVNDPRTQGYGQAGGGATSGATSGGGSAMRNVEDAFSAIGHAPTSDDPDAFKAPNTSDNRQAPRQETYSAQASDPMMDGPPRAAARDGGVAIPFAKPPAPMMNADDMMRSYFREVRINKAQ